MSKQFNPSRTVVMPRASRIRRDPPPPQEKERFWRSREWERRLAVIGVGLIAIALALIWVGLGYVTSDDGKAPMEVRLEIGEPT